MTVLLLSVGLVGLESQTRGNDLLSEGMDTFASARYDDALRVFRDVILDSGLKTYHGDAYFWIAKSYMALAQYENSSKNLEFFIGEFPTNPYFPESLYQRGRLLFLQGDHESAIQAFYAFMEQYAESNYLANSYFWIGECLYTLGHFEDALSIFSVVVDKYPTSFKVEAARYRISLIELKEREQELLKLLKYSHEEYLRAIEQFERKEKSYEQALASFQRKMREEDSPQSAAPTPEDYENTAPLKEQIEIYKSQISDLRSQLARKAESSVESAVEPAALSTQITKLLDIKETLLELKSYYLDWIEANR